MDLFEIIRRMDINDQLNLLPAWQRAYFSSEKLSHYKNEIADYLYNARDEFFKDKQSFVKVLEVLNRGEIEELNDFLFLRSTKKTANEIKNQLLSRSEGNKLNKKLQSFFEVFEEETTIQQSYEIENEYAGQSSRFFELLDYQVYIKEQLMSFLEEDILLGKVLVHMPTGTGKTKTSMHLITQYYQNNLKESGLILWIAHTNVLLEQAQDTLRNVWFHFGEKALPIYRLYGGYQYDISRLVSEGGVAFCNISTLIETYSNNPSRFSEIRGKVNLIVFDEAHKCLAEESNRVLEDIMRIRSGYPNRHLIGLTATPGRSTESSEENQRLAEFFEKRIITIDSQIVERFSKSEFSFENEYDDKRIIKYFQDRKILAKLRREVLNYDLRSEYVDELDKKTNKKSKAQDYVKEVIELVATNIERNKVILDRLIELDKDRIPTIFFACSVEHGKFISTMLRINNVKTCEVYGETNSLKRNKEIDLFRSGYSNILINCSVLTTGFDATNIRCVFISRPTKSIVLYSQMIGRGLRGIKMGGNEECLLIDLHDNLTRFSDENEAFSYFEDYWR